MKSRINLSEGFIWEIAWFVGVFEMNTATYFTNLTEH